jgi:hypothetical protein
VSKCRLDKLLSPSVLTVHMRVPYVPRSQGNSKGRRKPDPPGRKEYKSPNVRRSKPDLLVARSRSPRPTPPPLCPPQHFLRPSSRPCSRSCGREDNRRRDSISGPRTALGPTGRAGELPSEAASELTSRASYKV